jgi:hypothetical protein
MPEEFDDVDGLFARIGMIDPPEDLFGRVMALARADGAVRQPVGRAPVLYAGIYVFAIAALAVLAYQLGTALAASGTTSLLSVLVRDTALASDAPSAYIGALLASLPLFHIAGVLIDLAILGTVTAFVIRVAGGGGTRRIPEAAV